MTDIKAIVKKPDKQTTGIHKSLLSGCSVQSAGMQCLPGFKGAEPFCRVKGETSCPVICCSASYPTGYYLAHSGRQICSFAAPRCPYPAHGALCVTPRKERWSLKLTRHNGRAGKHGTYNPKHNDRSFDLTNSEHIDPERVPRNIYWDCYNGIRSAMQPKSEDDFGETFADASLSQILCKVQTAIKQERF